jgi:hypothetical protein
LLSPTNVRAPLEKVGRLPRRHPRQNQFINRQPARNRPRVASQQDTQGIFGLADRTLEVRDAREGILVLGLRLAEIHLEDNAFLKTQLEQIQGIFAAFGFMTCDLQLFVQGTELHIGNCHGADQRQYRAAPTLLGSEQLGPSRLGGTSEFAPEVQLPAGTEEALVKIKGIVLSVNGLYRVFFAQPLAKGVGTAAYIESSNVSPTFARKA